MSPFLQAPSVPTSFASHTPQLTVFTGIGASRPQEIVDSVRKVINTASTLVHEQSLASKVLLRQFYEPNGDDKLRTCSLRCQEPRLIGHGWVAKRDQFVKIYSKETEHVWGLLGQGLPKTLYVASTRRVFEDPVPVWTDLIAGPSFTEPKPQANFGEGDFSELNLISHHKWTIKMS